MTAPADNVSPTFTRGMNAKAAASARRVCSTAMRATRCAAASRNAGVASASTASSCAVACTQEAPLFTELAAGAGAAIGGGGAGARADQTSTAGAGVANTGGGVIDTNGFDSTLTGVISGAAEARSIQRALDAATEAYNAAVASARARIHSLGEQTLGTVQMASQSRVVNATAQAAEAIAAAQNGVNVCKAEVIPLMGMVAREFSKLNS